MSTLYRDDFVSWTREQAESLRRARDAGSNLPLDWANLIEEIESLGASERRELRSHLARIVEHLAKLHHSPARWPRRGWMRTVQRHRDMIEQLLADSPSLRGDVPGLIAAAWRNARRDAAKGLQRHLEQASLPEQCPFQPGQILDPDWFPQPPASP
ncbi:MAG: DUF29 domain-containing protein [Geminicoccaceae bacterium]